MENTLKNSVVEIQNLTAEIEAFTKITDTDESCINVGTNMNQKISEIDKIVVNSGDRVEDQGQVSSNLNKNQTTGETDKAETSDREENNVKNKPSQQLLANLNCYQARENIEESPYLEKDYECIEKYISFEKKTERNNELFECYLEKPVEEINFNLDNQIGTHDREDKSKKIIELSRASEERNFEIVVSKPEINDTVNLNEVSCAIEEKSDKPHVIFQQKIENSIIEIMKNDKSQTPEKKSKIEVPNLMIVEEIHHVQETPEVYKIQDISDMHRTKEEKSMPIHPDQKPTILLKKKTIPTVTTIGRDVEFFFKAQTPETKPNNDKYDDSRITDIKSSNRSSDPSLQASPNHSQVSQVKTSSSKTHQNTLKTVKSENYEFQVRYIPLQSENKRESRYEQWAFENMRRCNEDIHNNGKQRSVKDIIESINKSQSLLKPHVSTNTTTNTGQIQTELPIVLPPQRKCQKTPNNDTLTITESTDSLTRNLNCLLEDEIKLHQFLNEMNDGSCNYNPRHSNNDNVNNTLEKCVIRKKSAIDWNPIPKPRRSRNLSEELKNTNSSC